MFISTGHCPAGHWLYTSTGRSTWINATIQNSLVILLKLQILGFYHESSAEIDLFNAKVEVDFPALQRI